MKRIVRKFWRGFCDEFFWVRDLKSLGPFIAEVAEIFGRMAAFLLVVGAVISIITIALRFVG